MHRNYHRVLTAVRMHTTAGRKELNGVYRFLGEGHDWDMDLIRTETDVTPDLITRALDGGFDGLLIATVEPPGIRRLHEGSDVPVVFIDYPDARALRKVPRSVFVHDNAADILQTATGHLLKCKGLRHFAFVPTRDSRRWSDDRQHAFVRALSARGESFSTFGGGGDDRTQLIDWLRDLPKPVGIIAAFDDRAHDVIECCRIAGLAVPDDVSVLGIGNDELVCENETPALSSVAIDFENQGYRAARELHALMQRRLRPRQRDIAVGDLGVVLRASTALPTDAMVLARRTTAYVNAHALEGIGVPDVVRHLRVSRRLADLRYREATGRTILEAILERRMSEAKRLLVSTDLSVADIAVRCGYRDGNYFKNAFRRLVGCSPRDWRRNG